MSRLVFKRAHMLEWVLKFQVFHGDSGVTPLV
jgi:hypothetical protein